MAVPCWENLFSRHKYFWIPRSGPGYVNINLSHTTMQKINERFYNQLHVVLLSANRADGGKKKKKYCRRKEQATIPVAVNAIQL